MPSFAPGDVLMYNTWYMEHSDERSVSVRCTPLIICFVRTNRVYGELYLVLTPEGVFNMSVFPHMPPSVIISTR